MYEAFVSARLAADGDPRRRARSATSRRSRPRSTATRRRRGRRSARSTGIRGLPLGAARAGRLRRRRRTPARRPRAPERGPRPRASAAAALLAPRRAAQTPSSLTLKQRLGSCRCTSCPWISSHVLRHAVAAGASDVHLKLGQPPVLRIDGELEPIDRLRPARRRRPRGRARRASRCVSAPARALRRDAATSTSRTRQPGLPRFRVNGFRQRGAISFAFRVIPSEIPSFDELHLPPGVARLAEEQRGLVLVTGATGSGKTTTLASMLDEINRTRRQHIVTIEDPIEILHPDRGCIVNQREVGLDTESFEQALRRVLRQDPDVILIGELARRGDRADRAAGGRVGPPRLLDAAHARRRRDDRAHGRVLPAREAAAGRLDPRGRPARRHQPAARCRASTADASRPSR